VPIARLDELVASSESGLGSPARRAGAGGEGVTRVVASWERPGWTIAVSRHAVPGAPVLAVLRVEYDEAAPPVVLGVPLGRRRAAVESTLAEQGAVLVQRDPEATTYVGCPQGTGDAVSCLVHFHDGRASAVTEVLPAPLDDKGALQAWRLAAARLEKEIGHAAETACPAEGPDRVEGDCTATWSSARLVVVVGAHRSAGGKHRGAISVYTGYTYPALAAGPTASKD
jgi:hypothetical protein